MTLRQTAVRRFLVPAILLLLPGILLIHHLLSSFLGERLLQASALSDPAVIAAQASYDAAIIISVCCLMFVPVAWLGFRWYLRHIDAPMQTLEHELDLFRSGRRLPHTLPESGISEFESLHDAMREAAEQFQLQDARERAMRQSIASHSSSDALTGISNRSRLGAEIESLITRYNGHNTFALLYLDLDHFKRINDTVGHEIGDELLKACAARIHAALDSRDFLARIGGDEFVVLISSRHKEEDFVAIAKSLLALLHERFHIREYEFSLTASIGISVYPDHGKTAAALIKHADIAMYEAKEDGRNGYRRFHPEMLEHVQNQIFLEQEMKEALHRGEFSVFYQPQVDTLTAKVVGAEALLRWLHPEHGMIAPDRFIPIAEKSGWIFELGEWVLEQACSLLARHKEIMMERKLSVNISPMQFRQPDFAQRVKRLIERYDVSPELLVFEITETLFMADRAKSLATLNTFKSMGISIAMDDFGTGYSSLSYLKEFPVDIIKIDKSFIQGAFDNSEDYNIVKAVVSLGNELGLQVVAEGVEQLHQYELLRTSHCGAIQGYLFSKPLPEAEYLDYLRQQSTKT